jgi:NAD(P)-dependent dehydrogenase (short-subunit alcohol dehydrogenase family)
VSVLPLDVNDPVQAQALVASLRGRTIDVFVCNAGINSPPATIDAVDEDGFLGVMRTNVMAPMRLVGLLADHIARSEQKTMLFLGSWMGSMGANNRRRLRLSRQQGGVACGGEESQH